jgi:hypothetical protein
MEKLVTICKNYACERHAFVNQSYDGKPYSFHLEMGISFFHKYSYLLTEYEKPFAEGGLWCHDIISDARETYNDVKETCGEIVANISYALHNEKGKTPDERENQKYYDGIVEEGRLAIFGKLCDRLANGTYSKSKGSGMYKKYKLRYPRFKKALNVITEFKPMWDELDELFDYTEPLFCQTITQENHICRYSKAMNQPHPRLCVVCGKPENIGKILEENIKEITKDELTNDYSYYLTVGDLKEFLYKHNLPNDSKVVIQRIEDVYYEKHQWGVYLKEGENTFKDENGVIVKESLEQYHPAFCCAKYDDDPNVLFINLHY